MRSIFVMAGGLLLAFGTTHSLAGCSSDKEPTIVYVEAGATSGGSSSSSAGGRGQLLPDGGEDCSKTSDLDTCGECCRDQNPVGSDKYATLVVACYCQSDDFCKQQCKDSLCVQKLGQAGDPCDLCLTAKNETCGMDVNPKCFGDPECAPILNCLIDAACDSKPQL